MHNLTIVNYDELPPANKLCTYFLDLAAEVQVQLKDCNTIRQLAWKIGKSIPQQYMTVFISSVIRTKKTSTNLERECYVVIANNTC